MFTLFVKFFITEFISQEYKLIYTQVLLRRRDGALIYYFSRMNGIHQLLYIIYINMSFLQRKATN